MISVKKWLRSKILRIKFVLSTEKNETKEMLTIYRRYLSGKSTPDEIKFANNQAKDVLRTVGVTGLVILPGTIFVLPIVVALGRKLGIDILPESFYQEDVGYKEVSHECPVCNSPIANKDNHPVSSIHTFTVVYECGYGHTYVIGSNHDEEYSPCGKRRFSRD